MDFKNRTLTFKCLSLIYLLAYLTHKDLKLHRASISFIFMLDMSTLWQELWSWGKGKISVLSQLKTHSRLTSWPTSQLPYLKWHNCLLFYPFMCESKIQIKINQLLFSTLKPKPLFPLWPFWVKQKPVLLCLPKDNNSWFPNTPHPSFSIFQNHFFSNKYPFSQMNNI